MWEYEKIAIRRRSMRPLAAGLVAAQGVATLFVWQSNIHLQQRIDAIEAAGWMALPNGPAAVTLQTMSAAFWGGLFFTLSTGAGLTLSTWAALYVWRWLLHGNRGVLWLLAGAWLAVFAAVNAGGWVLFPSLFVIIIPLATALGALQGLTPEASGHASSRWRVSFLTLLLLAGIWATQFNSQAFTTLRDYLLLSNTLGSKVNDFYYRYTLYAAEAFKGLDQKSQRTWRLDSSAQRPADRRFVRAMADEDFLETPGFPLADLVVVPSPGQLLFVSPTGRLLEIDSAVFFENPTRWLRTFSEITDRYGFFRRLAFVGLLLGFPVLLYVMAHGAAGRLAGCFLRGPRAVSWAASAVCLAVGLLLFIPFLGGRPGNLPVDILGPALEDADWRRRVAALRRIEQEGLDIARFHYYRGSLHSPWAAERYWLARALAFSPSAAAYADLLELIHDPHPNVVCQAFYALGRLGDPRAIERIQSRMARSDHWYIQWYGYRAMKGLGWRQSRSASTP